jgi:hypothetical protein
MATPKESAPSPPRSSASPRTSRRGEVVDVEWRELGTEGTAGGTAPTAAPSVSPAAALLRPRPVKVARAATAQARPACLGCGGAGKVKISVLGMEKWLCGACHSKTVTFAGFIRSAFGE